MFIGGVLFAEPACEHVEGGRYVGPEFQLGQVYDGDLAGDTTDVVLYRPVYVCVSSLRAPHVNNFAIKSSANTTATSKTQTPTAKPIKALNQTQDQVQGQSQAVTS